MTRISDLRGIFPFLREPLRHEDEQRTTEACEAMLALLPPGRVQELREVAAVYPYPDQLHEVLYELELSGVVQRLPGNRLQRISSLRADQPHRG